MFGKISYIQKKMLILTGLYHQAGCLMNKIQYQGKQKKRNIAHGLVTNILIGMY